ncbi:chitin synthase [Sodiomyces alkalinus F11]|uniref:chitin synthase n=1 Tax=Sodiomyces alkalinus (strain CBS 110278 / VKM F-3762 / F11) TaxID=1314773 RepID=A0A3N2PW62_SODAK|nr:chitin synthase [Sodiomyces alkalinus F11]ROT38741.1 chitin synthase [Sodiomyces alkalinus F11]
MTMNLPSLSAGSGAHSQASLPSLPAHLQSDTQLTAHLASRFHVSLPTAKLSSHALISINNYTSSSKGPDGGKEGSAMAGAEEMADRAWLRLGHRSENQAIVFLGESGSGKSTIRAHLLTAMLNKSSTPLSTKASLAAYVFDTLTTTKTATTPTASKAGLFYELQYDTSTTTNPVLVGSKLLDHRLERSRITDVPTGERNFHILYYLLAGTTPAEKTHLGLDDSTAHHRRWKYLGHPTQLKVGINDAEGFQIFKNALRKLEFPRSEIAEICQILATILHIGQLEFESSANTQVTGDDSGGFSHEGATMVTVAKNKDVLAIIAAFLGVSTQDLQTTLSYKTKMIHKERVTIMLDPSGARAHANELARTLYSLLVTYIIENVNQRLCAPEDSVANTVSIIDFPGFSQQTSTGSVLDQLLNNAATEALYNLTLQNFFDRKADLLENEDVAVAATSYFDNSDAVRGLLKPGNGLLSILDDQSRRNRTDLQFLESLRKRFEGKNPAITPGSSTAKLPGSNFLTENAAAVFTVKHFAGEVDYPVKGLVEENGEVISADLLNMVNSTKSDFVARLFGQDALQTVPHPNERSTVMQASISSRPMRAPSVMSRKTARAAAAARTQQVLQRQAAEPAEAEKPTSDTASQVGGSRNPASSDHGGAAGQFLAALDNVTRAVADPSTNSYFVFCLKSNDRRIANQFDSKCVRTQVQTFGIAEVSQRLRSADFSLFLPFGEFLGLVDAETMLVGSERERAELVIEDRRWPGNEVRVGSTGVFLSERYWMDIAQLAEASSASGRLGQPSDAGGGDGYAFGASKERLLSAGNTPLMYGEKTRSGFFGGHDSSDTRSEAGVSAFGGGDMFKNLDTREQMAERGNEKSLVEVEEYKDSPSRKRWVFAVYVMTWFIPDFFIRKLGRMPRKDVRVAWREKLAINLMIWLACGVAAFFMVGFPLLICPRQDVYSAQELSSYNGERGSRGAYISIRGYVFDLGAYAPRHYPPNIDTEDILDYAGMDVSSLFPVQVSALCRGRSGRVDPRVLLDYKPRNLTGSPTVINRNDLNARFHDFRYFTNDTREHWYYQQMSMLRSRYLKGRVGFSPQYISTLGRRQEVVVSMDGHVYDLTQYVIGGRPMADKPGRPEPNPGSRDEVDFMDESVMTLIRQMSGEDITKHYEALDIDPEVKGNMTTCLNNLFYVGDVDTRGSVRCQFAAYLVLAISALLASIIAFKFFAALQFGTKTMPENLDKFIMCQIPAYTEDEESLRRAIDSAARMRYDDKRKLLVIVCDGMIIGQGNDRPTPRIVLDILGVPETVDPEPLSFESLGEGLKQHNMGKVYSGLYEVQGHIVPFLVIVKVGKPSEVSRPGNRGKRDSQMVIMRFLNRVHYNLAMTPLELEMYHQIRNVIGVNPTFYEFMFQIDADTDVAPDSATRMISAFLDDTRIIAVCGETALSNAKSSFITMIQVYEYWISHNLTKAFESLFGSVTCLPGCFSMYRIRAAETGKPLFVCREVVEAYATIRVDTLHMKNLLHLGEDRYLTTLLLKYHNKYKTKYIRRAQAWTIAPDSWKVFLSQRRRWINSTVHNLMELIPMTQLCGFCCFSMRFVVFVDLLSTIVQPVVVAYIVYLIVLVARNPSFVPITAFILLAAIYGLQAIIFILRRKWEMIGWMILYIIAIPVFSFGLPLYAFWHMDDFNWGNTRVVAGEHGKKVVITDEGKFDPSSIPRKKWEEYQAELWENQTIRDDAHSEVSGYSYATKKGQHGAQVAVSEYGYPHSRPGSFVGGYGGGGAAITPPLPPYGGGVGGIDSRNLSRMSLAASEMMGGFGQNNINNNNSNNNSTPNLGNRASQFGGSQFFSPEELAGLPSDDALLAEIREILRTADLMTVTKKGIKQELERRFGVALDAKRAYINSATEALVSGQL